MKLMKKNLIYLSLTLLSFQSYSNDQVNNATLEEVVVTGLRQDSSLRDAPASVSVLTKDAIQNAGITKNTDFIAKTAGVNIVQGATQADSQVSIRGLYNARLTEVNYALIIDGILIPNITALNRELIDLEQIEVIKGAQSALYGRNAISGAIVINTIKPSFDESYGTVKLTLGNNNSNKIQVLANAPLGEQFGIKFFGSTSRTDGFYNSAYSESIEIDQATERDLGFRIFGNLDDSSTIDIKYAKQYIESGAVNFNSTQQGFNPANANDPTFQNTTLLTDINNISYKYLNNVPNSNTLDSLNFSVKLDYDFGNENGLFLVLSRNEYDSTLLGDGTAGQATYAESNTAVESALSETAFTNFRNTPNSGFAQLEQGVAQALAATPDFSVFGVGAYQAALGFLQGGTADAETALYNAYYAATYPNLPLNYRQCLETSSSSVQPNAPYNNSTLLPSYSATTCDGYQYQRRAQEDTNFEIRYSSNQEQDLAWVAGVSVHDITSISASANGEDHGDTIIENELNARDSTSPTTVLYSDTYHNLVLAAFGSLKFNFTDGFNVSFDVRYDRETKTVVNNVPNTSVPTADAINYPGDPTCDSTQLNLSDPSTYCGVEYLNVLYNFNGGQLVKDETNTYSQLQPKLVMSYIPEDTNLNFYASYGLGFRSGGFNFTGLEATVNYYYCPNGLLAENALQPCNALYDAEGNVFVSTDPNLYQLQVYNVKDEYKKEISNSFETGVKYDFDEGSSFIEFALYSNQVENLQTFSYFAGAFGLLYGITNIDEAEVSGLEFSGKFQLSEDFSMGFGLSSITTEIIKNTNRPYTEGNQVPYIPESDANLYLQYKGRVGDTTDLVVRLDYSQTGATWFSAVQGEQVTNIFSKYSTDDPANLPCIAISNPIATPPCSIPSPTPTSDLSSAQRDAFSVMDLRIEVIAEDLARIAFWGKNILDERYPVEVIAAAEAGQAFVLQSGGASYGIDVAFSF